MTSAILKELVFLRKSGFVARHFHRFKPKDERGENVPMAVKFQEVGGFSYAYFSKGKLTL